MNTIQHYIHKKPKGFTIVELLIVIVVIAILAAISIVAYTNIQARAQDSATDSAVQQLRRGLDLYHVDRGEYPHVCQGSSCSVDRLATSLVPDYLGTLPSTEGVNYVVNGTRDSYGLRVMYESREPCKIVAGPNPASSWWGADLPEC